MPHRFRRKPAARDAVDAPFGNVWTVVTELVRLTSVWITKLEPTPTLSIGKTNAEIFYDGMVKRIEWQLQASEAYDAKTSSWFALTALVATVSSTALAAEHALLYWLPIMFAVLGSVFWLSALIASYLVGQQGQISVGPTERDFHNLITDAGYNAVDVQSLIAEFIATVSIPNNERLLVRKASLLSWAIRFSLIEFVCFGVAVFVTLLR